MIQEYLSYLQEKYDYVKNHGHNICKIDSVERYFHNFEHGYKHCKGGAKNPYIVEHHGKGHIISTQYARGHGSSKKIQWFKFPKKVKTGWWELESGVKISIDQTPQKLRYRNKKMLTPRG